MLIRHGFSASICYTRSCLRSIDIITLQNQRHYASPGGKKSGPTLSKVRVAVETDTVLLHDYVCGSHYVTEDRQDIKIKDNSEYPDWLWEVRLGKLPPMHEMDPNSKPYLIRVQRLGKKQSNLLRSKRGY